MRSKEAIKGIISPDRHIRLLAGRTMRTIEPIRDALELTKSNPEQLGERGFIFDSALAILQSFLLSPKDVQKESTYSNLEKLRDMNIPNSVFGNSISWLSAKYQGIDEIPISSEEASNNAVLYATAEQTFSIVADRIKSGEWSYVNDIKDSGVVISALLIEGWGEFLESLTQIEGVRPIFVRALEEVLGTDFSDSALWRDVKPWVLDEADLFSQDFIRSIQ